MKFVKTLNLDSTQKNISLLFCKEDSVEIPVFESVNVLLQWCEQVLLGNKEALCLFLIEKSSFSPEQAPNLVDSFRNAELLGETDVYFRNLYQSELAAQVQVTRIDPCTIVHIKKYSEAEHKIVVETSQDYESRVLPYIHSIPPERTAWIQKVINGQSKEPILIQDADCEIGFTLVPDLKWDRKSWSKMYLLAIAKNDQIKSLRDLNGTHLDFLKSLRDRVLAYINETYRLTYRDVRMLVHYQPSYYHFHVHIIHVEIKGLSGTLVGQCHLLDDIVDNLEIDSDYYKKKTLRYALNVLHPLYDILK
jgi:m7GpppX diphosphatase